MYPVDTNPPPVSGSRNGQWMNLPMKIHAPLAFTGGITGDVGTATPGT